MDSKIDRNWARAKQYFARGELTAAKAVCEGLLLRIPGLALAHWMLSMIEQHRGRLRPATSQALAACGGADSLPPDAALLVSRQLLGVGEYQAALGILQRIDHRLHHDVATSIDVADQLSLLEDQENALACLERARAKGLRHPQLSFLHGNALKFLGRFADSAIAYEDAIKLDALHARAHWSLAQLGERAGAAKRVDRIRQALTTLSRNNPSPGDALADQSVLGYALFWELDRLDDIDGAWQALAAAMRIRRGLIEHDPEAETRLVDHLIETLTPGFFSADERVTGDPTPIFILGMPRSGTTLLERILGNHPDVAACGELNDFRMQFKWCTDHYCRGFLDMEGAKRIPTLDYPALGRAYLDHVAWRARGKHWFTDKSPGNFMLAGPIIRALPHARIIHLRRNPIDTCFSNLKELFSNQFYCYSYSIEDVATHWRNYSRLMQHMSSVAPDSILEVTYEELVREPDAQAARVVQFCNLSPSSGISDITANDAPVSTASSIQVREAIHDRAIDSWRRYAYHLAPLEDLLRRGFS